MKQYVLSLIIFGFCAIGCSTAYAQRSGEMDRFSNEQLYEKNNVVKMFPNPTTDFLNVKLEKATIKLAEFKVHNIIGNEVVANVEKLADNEFRIRIEDLEPGYYFLAMRDKEGYFKETYKFLKR